VYLNRNDTLYIPSSSSASLAGQIFVTNDNPIPSSLELGTTYPLLVAEPSALLSVGSTASVLVHPAINAYFLVNSSATWAYLIVAEPPPPVAIEVPAATPTTTTTTSNLTPPLADNTGAIAGGIVAGVVAIALIIALLVIFLVIRPRKAKEQQATALKLKSESIEMQVPNKTQNRKSQTYESITPNGSINQETSGSASNIGDGKTSTVRPTARTLTLDELSKWAVPFDGLFQFFSSPFIHCLTSWFCF